MKKVFLIFCFLFASILSANLIYAETEQEINMSAQMLTDIINGKCNFEFYYIPNQILFRFPIDSVYIKKFAKKHKKVSYKKYGKEIATLKGMVLKKTSNNNQEDIRFLGLFSLKEKVIYEVSIGKYITINDIRYEYNPKFQKAFEDIANKN